MQFSYSKITPILFFILIVSNAISQTRKKQIPVIPKDDPEYVFNNPPEDAKPGVLWMWMGSNVSQQGITKDLEALKAEGFNSATMSTLADVTMPWSAVIKKSPTPDIIGWTEPWWKLVRYATEEAKRLNMTLGLFNCPGYEASGGPWITPELSMQELCWSTKVVKGNTHVNVQLLRPSVNPRANMRFPVYNPHTGLVENPEIPERSSYYRDISVLAVPAKGPVSKDSVIDISDKMDLNGRLRWDAPAGNWMIYRFGHTTTGALIQPAQPQATGLECDKMSEKAVSFHMDHMISEIKKHLGNLAGTVMTDVYFDSYEIDDVTWTPNMKQEFLKRKGYDITPFLITLANRRVGSKLDSIKFGLDFDNTVRDLYRDVYFATISKKLKEANLRFLSEPYGGPWRPDDVVPQVHRTMVEFWTDKGVYSPYELVPTLAAIRKTGQNLIQAEAFTGQPAYSKWDEYPAWLKPIGDAAFCVGVNRIIIHRFAQQPWGDRYQPGEAMGQWGTHFDRTQTWWKPAATTVKYWTRCQALLQWGKFAATDTNMFVSDIKDSIALRNINRVQGNTSLYFVANLAHRAGSATCTFKVSGMQPELWDAVTGSIRDLQQFKDDGKFTSISLSFDDAQSFFVVFRHPVATRTASKKNDFPTQTQLAVIKGAWQVQFDHRWGGPEKPVTLDSLTDWTTNTDNGIKYFSGTAIYTINFDAPGAVNTKKTLYLDLGKVKHIARVSINNKDMGVIWTAPWSVKIPAGLLKKSGNTLVVEVTNVWANRLIGDEQEPDDCKWLPSQYLYDSGKYLKEFPEWFLKNEPRPSKGRYCFTTWNYFTKDSPLIPSGLMGPVRIMSEN
ncbi:glycosyl hydrolase [Mucilaginibacter sp. X5P1]|uniref:glycosyl hydrolase n=1 Tax=Mucilaginibacter sp. X5P1 TaxID=2723088 RepID=UPI0016088602|nr:glycosyl hydrolase [Mucilaginibacter sp. X5P1]MBB6138531.1 hypothetical protein [Mucilaginibacter sp. X5P1]